MESAMHGHWLLLSAECRPDMRVNYKTIISPQHKFFLWFIMIAKQLESLGSKNSSFYVLVPSSVPANKMHL